MGTKRTTNPPELERLATPRARDAVTELPAFDVGKLAKERVTAACPAEDERLESISNSVRYYDYDNALVLARSVLRERPEDLVALAWVEECGAALEALHIFSSAALRRVPCAAIGGPPLYDLKLDHRAGFILSLVDGVSTVSLILDMCPMPRPEVLRMIFGLNKDGILVLK